MRMHLEMALSHALGGAAFGGTVFAKHALDPNGTDTDTGLYLWLVGAACLGAGIAGALCTPTYGHPRLAGWIGAALGFTLATYAAGLICGNFLSHSSAASRPFRSSTTSPQRNLYASSPGPHAASPSTSAPQLSAGRTQHD